MRFKDFIVESTFDLDKFRKDCAYYFDQMDGHHGYLWHGNKNGPTDWSIQTFKARTGPRDSNKEVHDRVNEYFDGRFGYPFRNGLFTTGRKIVASSYGQSYAIFPIGKFEWLCSASRAFDDMTAAFDTYMSKVASSSGDYDERERIATELMLSDMGKIDWQLDDNLPRCIESNAEIMLKCDKYYAFSFIGDTFQHEVSPFTDTL